MWALGIGIGFSVRVWGCAIVPSRFAVHVLTPLLPSHLFLFSFGLLRVHIVCSHFLLYYCICESVLFLYFFSFFHSDVTIYLCFSASISVSYPSFYFIPLTQHLHSWFLPSEEVGTGEEERGGVAKPVGLTMASLYTSGCGWGHRERLFAWEGVGVDRD